jgi:translocation and assembly module TamB
MTLSGDRTPFLLSGEYNVYEGLIDSNFDQGGSGESTDLLEELLKKEITSPLLVNIDIRTKNAVEIRNNLVEGYMLGDLKIYDKINAPRIKGEAHFDENAIIRFRDQEFEVTSSSFLFEGQSPINPKLSLRSQTRLNNYDVELFLQGRAAKPVITWSSQPPLPESQIVSMLALGTLPDQFNQNNNAAATDTTDPQGFQNNNNGNSGTGQGFEVGTDLLSNNPLGRELKERYNVDVQFSSSFDDQNNAAVPKVTLRRRVTKKMQVSVSATTGTANQQEGRVTYELNNDLSTIFRITNRPNDANTNFSNQNNIRQQNPFGVDLEYRVEFD